ncbi:MAG: hypothetical protein K0S86_1544 [Geminicoccaceae bacterium]|jgi:hypothetical protein|nr:hypothetical protein [Geminicoccaceae bacterium]
MPRALTIVRSKVARHERDAYFAGLRDRRDRLRAAQCNFWVYEDPGDPGLFIEFTEARDSDTLVAAHAAVADAEAAPPILTEVDLS